MTQTNNERVDITPLQKVNAVQSIREAKTLDDALRVMNGLAANGWLKLWDSATHPDGTSWRDKSPISQNEQQEAVAYTDGKGDFITKEMYDEYLKLGFYTECIVPLYTSPKQIPDGWISVKDRLPEVDQYCLYYAPIFEQKNAWSNVWAGIYDGNGNFSSRSGFLGGQEVTHWMPLPAAPTNTEVGE